MLALVWRLDHWGRSLLDLVTALQELTDLNIGFVSLSEALDLTTSTGRAMVGMLSVFAAFEQHILREGWVGHAWQSGMHLGCPATAAMKAAEKELFRRGVSKPEISRRLDIGRTSVRHLLAQKKAKSDGFTHVCQKLTSATVVYCPHALDNRMGETTGKLDRSMPMRRKASAIS